MVLGVVLAIVAGVAIGARAAARYSRDAGLPRGRTLSIWMPSAWDLPLGSVLGGWNEAAGHRLFERSDSKAAADVGLAPSDAGSYTVCLGADGSYDLRQPYASCTVYLAYHGRSRATVITAQHELGHTLGFVDHVESWRYADFAGLSPRVCDDPENPAYSPYRGVMSFCTEFETGISRADARSLERAGY